MLDLFTERLGAKDIRIAAMATMEVYHALAEDIEPLWYPRLKALLYFYGRHPVLKIILLYFDPRSNLV
jgi:hypothetical protein